jgi:hypothetical protein
MSERSSIKFVQGLHSVASRNMEDVSTYRRKFLPYFLSQLEICLRENRQAAVKEIELYMRAQLPTEQECAKDELIQAVANYPHLAAIVQLYITSKEN